MTNLVFEITRAVVILVIFCVLWHYSARDNLKKNSGLFCILLGFGFILFGVLLDITDNFPQLNQYFVVGDTIIEAFLEKIVGFMTGYVLVAIGLWKWLPDILALEKAQVAFQNSEARYKSLVENIGAGISLISPNMEILSINRQMELWFPGIKAAQKPICYKVFNDPPGEDVCWYCPVVESLHDGLTHEAITHTPTNEGTI